MITDRRIELKIARIKKGLSQIELARLLNCSEVVICSYEAGRRTPSREIQNRIAKILEVKVDDIFPPEKKAGK